MISDFDPILEYVFSKTCNSLLQQKLEIYGHERNLNAYRLQTTVCAKRYKKLKASVTIKDFTNLYLRIRITGIDYYLK